jgi:hypothetical protein
VFGKHVGYKSGIGRCFGIFPVMAVSGKMATRFNCRETVRSAPGGELNRKRPTA